jgi:hypothetical protein
MSVIGSNILAGASGQGGYFLTNSLRFRSSASGYLNRTPASASNRQTWTYSAWFKRGTLGQDIYLLTGESGSNNDEYTYVTIKTDEKVRLVIGQVGSNPHLTDSAAVFRDPSAWYHIVSTFDSTQATAANRWRLYVNGVEQTMSGTVMSQNYNSGWINNNNRHGIMGRLNYATNTSDGYLTEVNFIDGQALTPSSFGETSTSTGVWIPKKYTGTYGTNGFYLKFTDTTSTSTLGTDFSGNSNTWTVNNISLTAGSTYDSMTDVPTLTSATAANYCVLNPLTSGSFNTISNANLKVVGNTSTNNGNTRSTIYFTTGKWYIEMTAGAIYGSAYPSSGIIPASNAGVPDNGGGNQVGVRANSVAYEPNGNKRVANSTSSYGNSYTTGDVIGIAIDADNGAIYFSKNGTFQNSGVPTSGGSKTGSAFNWTGGSIEYVFATAQYDGSDASFNFGQQPFAYTPPTGFVALNTFNLPTPTIGATASTTANKYFDAVTRNGFGSSGGSVTSLNFQPDFWWEKARSTASNHTLIDSIRGVTKELYSNLTNAESTGSNFLTSFNSNGFTMGSNDWGTSTTLVDWVWKAGGSGGVTNTAGSITSTVSANTSAGFSIATFTGNGTGGATVGHGLGVTPSMVIVKKRSGVADWAVQHISLGANASLRLNGSDATANEPWWNSTTPSSTVFTLGSSNTINQSGETFVAYCFAPVAGYSAMGSYTGNGSDDGTFVFTGFRPRFLMVKRTDTTSDWVVIDSARNTYNAAGTFLYPNLSNAEDVTTRIDFVSNGFKWRTTAGCNNSGSTWIYMAVAENPFKYAVAR